MLSGEKILITGPGGTIAYPLARRLARDNEVWGIGRFNDPAQLAEVHAAGITTRRVDLENVDLSEVPQDFTYLLHLAVAYEPSDYDRAIRINAEATGHLLAHCRTVKAALVMSSISLYKPNPDPWHPYAESDPLGDILIHMVPTYSVSKIAEEAVSRFCASHFNIPTIIARMNAAYGPRGGLPTQHVQAVADGRPVLTRGDPCPYAPIHDDDIADQLEALLDAASVPATIVNWCGDEAVSVQQWSAYAGELLNTEWRVETSGGPAGFAPGGVGDATKRRSITGPCKVSWREGIRRTAAELYPDRVVLSDA